MLDINFDPAWLVAVYLISLRVGAVLVLSPIFSHMNGVVTVRVLFTLALSVVLASGVDLKSFQVPLEFGPLLSASLAELVVGITLAFGVFAAFGAFSVAGKILDIQTGFGLASVFDPVTAADSPLFASMLNLLAVCVFFGMDAHHALMRGIMFSLHQVPPGTGLSSLPIVAVIHQFGLMFSLGTALIAPVMICLLLVEACFGMISRVLPQMNVFVVSIPVKIVVGLFMFALTIGSLGPQMSRVYASIFTFWEQVLL
jgi:flagellar biosynthetic protein FliR